MSYTNVAIFREKGQKSFSSLTSEFYEKMGQKKIIVDFFLLAFYSKLGHFDKNLNQVHIRVFLFRTFFF
jgi:truncated hemoglobin YjbI